MPGVLQAHAPLGQEFASGVLGGRPQWGPLDLHLLQLRGIEVGRQGPPAPKEVSRLNIQTDRQAQLGPEQGPEAPTAWSCCVHCSDVAGHQAAPLNCATMQHWMVDGSPRQ